MIFKKFRILIVCLTGIFLSMPAVVFAGADSGFYLGAGAGDATVKYTDFDESDSAYKVFGGYNIGFIPLVGFASVRAEFEYYDLDSDLQVEMVSVSGIYTF